MDSVERTWLKNYEKGVPQDVSLAYQSLVDLMEDSFEKFKERPAYTCMGKTLTYQQVDELSQALAVYFTKELKLEKGDRVAVMAPNVLQYPVAIAAILRAGLIVVNVNPLYTARELEHQLIDSGVKAIIIVENFANVLAEVESKTQVKQVLTTTLGEFLGFPKKNIVNFVVKHVKKMVPQFTLKTPSLSLSAAIKKGSQGQFSKTKVTQDDLAFLQYTGGTTGVSKGAMLTHGNMVANTAQARAWVEQYVTIGKEVIITALPLYHIFSLTANCLTFMMFGAQNILITNPRDIPNFVKELKKYPFTAFTGVNTLFNALLNNDDFRSIDFSPLRLSLGGGMAVQKAVAQEWQKVTKCPLSQAYGLTETSPAVCMNPLSLSEFNGTIGLPISSTYVKILDEDENQLPLGEPGELCVKGPQVMKGYWQRDDETKKCFTKDNWFKTGDIATIDQEGYVTLVDRKKDMILVSGFNVYPNEVEDVAALHSGVLEAAAIAMPDEKSGEAVKLFVVKKDQQLTAEALIEHCKKNLTGYKVPKTIVFKDELPKTNVGKILRRALRE